MAFIYVITNDINGKQYVGKTNNSIEKRLKEHIKDSRKERCEKRPLYNAMNKYGIEHFHIEKLEECSAEKSAEREEYWIAKLDTYGYNGYNATRGGDSKKYYDYKEIADKYLELQNQQETAKYFDCDVHTIRMACRDTKVDIIPMAEQNKKKYGYHIAMCDIQTNQILHTFNSIHEAANYLGDDNKNSHISQAISGQRKSAYGYKWIKL